MEHQIDAMWMGGMRFNALVQGHTIVMDAPERVGGTDEGPLPKPLVLTALLGCTGMDVVRLLRVKGKELTRFNVRVTGELSKQHPLTYISAHLIYDLQGAASDELDAMLAVERSQNELCGVSSMLKRIMPVTWEVSFNGRRVKAVDPPHSTSATAS